MEWVQKIPGQMPDSKARQFPNCGQMPRETRLSVHVIVNFTRDAALRVGEGVDDILHEKVRDSIDYTVQRR